MQDGTSKQICDVWYRRAASDTIAFGGVGCRTLKNIDRGGGEYSATSRTAELAEGGGIFEGRE